MILKTLPGTEVEYTYQDIRYRSVYLEDAKKLNAIDKYVLTSSNTSNPGVSHPNLYPNSSTRWTLFATITTGLYAWKLGNE
jgi:hypothetical protein